MADLQGRHADNAAGKFYVDSNCGGCQVCLSLAPENFKMTDDDDHALVCKQPEGDEETSACRDAIDSCPDDAIGDDGA